MKIINPITPIITIPKAVIFDASLNSSLFGFVETLKTLLQSWMNFLRLNIIKFSTLNLKMFHAPVV